MPKSAVLYIDLLGVQNLWASGGSTAVSLRINAFHRLVQRVIEEIPREAPGIHDYTVLLYGDAVTVLCENVKQAIELGIHFFVKSTFDEVNNRERPFWLRGAISTWRNHPGTGNTIDILLNDMTVGSNYIMEPDYLKVVAMEKSGFKGMRLLVEKKLVDIDDYLINWPNGRPVSYVNTLQQFGYSSIGQHADVLWMVKERETFKRLTGIIQQRFKKSTGDEKELEQAAWTRALFDQASSITRYYQTFR